MHEKASYKFNSAYGDILPFTRITLVFNRKCNAFIIDEDYSVVAYSYPMSVLAQVFNYRLSTIKGSLAVGNPFFGIAGIE